MTCLGERGEGEGGEYAGEGGSFVRDTHQCNVALDFCHLLGESINTSARKQTSVCGGECAVPYTLWYYAYIVSSLTLAAANAVASVRLISR